MIFTRFFCTFRKSGCRRCFLAYFGGPVVRLVGDTSAGPNIYVYTVCPTTKNIDIQRVWTTTTTGKRYFSDVSFLTSFKKKKILDVFPRLE